MSPRKAETPDPRDIVTEHAFQVSPRLLGTPLAKPWRRLVAVLVDLSLVGALVLFKEISGSLFAIALGWIMWRVADPDVDVHLEKRWMRRVLRVTAGVTAVAGLLAFVSQFVPGSSDDDGASPGTSAGPIPGVISGQLRSMGLSDVADLTAGMVRLQEVGDADTARVVGGRVATALYRTGATRSEVERTIHEVLVATARGTAWEDSVDAVLTTALSRVDSLQAERWSEADSLMDALVAAARAGDSAAVRELRPRVAEAASQRRARVLMDRIETLEERVEDAESTPGILAFVEQTFRDLGLGYGWLGLYFTAFLHLWQGHTPGKRLLGLRVVKVNGTEIGWWDAFGRLGGYAAGFVTGLLGFAQVLWDPNRQALHDRIAGTVVIRE